MDPLRFVPKITGDIRVVVARDADGLPFVHHVQHRDGTPVAGVEHAKSTRIENEARNFLEAVEGTNDVSDASVRAFLGDGRHARLMTARDPQTSVAQLQMGNLDPSIFAHELPHSMPNAPAGRPASLGSLEPDEMGAILTQAWKNTGGHAPAAPAGRQASLGSIDPEEMGAILRQAWKNAE